MKSENHIVKLSLHIDILLLKIKKHFVKEQEIKILWKKLELDTNLKGCARQRKQCLGGGKKKAKYSICIYPETYF